jgi:leucyl/phenylalanyl-tRNA--protein transferase
MFSLESNASKFAFICLSKLLREKDFTLIDCQIPNDHLMSMGCKEFPRKKYLEIMRENIFCETKKGKWTNWWDNPGS